MKSIILILLAFTLSSAVATGRDVKDIQSDTVRTDSARTALLPDTTRRTARTDTTARSGADTVVVYSASDSLTFSPSTRFMHMYGKSSIDYRTTKLKAERIDINWNSSTLVAYGVKDSADTTKKKMRGNPVMNDAGEEYTGSQIAYNFKTQRGYIRLAESQMSDAYYSGAEIRKVDKDVLLVSNGEYTTCDKADPDYHFASSEMKVIPHDKIIARPIFLYIEDVPVFVLPFGIFPNERGRRSGIIAPTFGEDSQLGRYLARGGYYWAISDYMDLTMRADWYNKGGWVVHGVYNYALRYDFTGSLDVNWASKHFGLRSDPTYHDERDYSISFRHHQEFDPTTRADIDFSFASNSYLRNTTTNINDYLQQDIISNATLNKSWEGTGNSLSLNIYRDQNLSSGNTLLRLPSISFSHAMSYPFQRSKFTGGSENRAWYEYIGFSYNGQAKGEFTKTPNNDSAKTFTRTERYGVEHSISVSASPKAGYFTISPQFSYNEQWYPENYDQFFNAADSTVETRKNNGFKAVRTFSMGVSASTKLYGIFPVHVVGLQGFRHTVVPTLSYSFSPDFGKSSWGYYGQYYNPKQNAEVTYNRYAQSLYGGAGSGEQQNINFSIGNIFEAKGEQEDSTKEAPKYQLLNLTAGASYNFAADSIRLSDMNVSYRTNIGSIVDIGGNAGYTFYRVDSTGNYKVNQFLVSHNEGLARLTQFSFNITTTLASGKVSPGMSTGKFPALADTTAKSTAAKPVKEEEGFTIPWNLSLTWDYSLNRSNPYAALRQSNIRGNLTTNFTKNWRLNLIGSYDFISKKVSAVTLELYRDLHCWEMNFTWYPTGAFRGFNLEIRVKAPELRDLKITKQGGVYTRG